MHEDYISISHISKKYDKDLVLKDVNAVLHKGEILGFLGPSGAGKTTTIKILTGQLMPTSGEAKVLGIDCHRIDERIYEQIGIVSDSSGVYERMSVYDNLKYFARLLNVPLKNIDPLLKRIGLYEHKKKPAAPSTALEIHRILKELKDDGMAIFLTTHNMEEATKLCDHVALLNEGVIVEYGTPEEICLKYNRIKKYRVQLTDGSRHVLLHGADTTGRITSWMNEDRIETLHTCEPTLETVFLEATGRELQ